MKHIAAVLLGVLLAGCIYAGFVWVRAEAWDTPIYQPGQPPKVTQLPGDAIGGDTVYLLSTNGSTPAGLYVCGAAVGSKCSQNANWVCATCGGGGFTAGGDLSGTPTNQTVIGVQGNPFLSGAPASGDFWRWNGSAWAHTGLVSGDIPNLDASKITSGTFNASQIPTTLNGDFVFTGNVTALSYTWNGTGESYGKWKDNASCTLAEAGFFRLCSAGGVPGISVAGGPFATIELQSRRGAANGYAPLNASGFVPALNLGSGTANNTTCLHGDNTWSSCSGGLTFPLQATADSASAPSYAWSAETNTGLFHNATGDISFAIQGTRAFAFQSANFFLLSDLGALNFGASSDTQLARKALGVLELRAGTNPTSMNFYSSWTDASDWTGLKVGWNIANTEFMLSATKAGTGTYQSLAFYTSDVARWRVTVAGALAPVASNTYDLGAPTNVVRWIYNGNGTNSMGSFNASCSNEGTTGTTVGLLVKRDPVSGLCKKADTTDTLNFLGIAGAESAGTSSATTGLVYVARSGEISATFDGAATPGDWAVASTVTAGQVHDSGVSCNIGMNSVRTVGCIISGGGVAGSYPIWIDNHPPAVQESRFGSSCATTSTQFNTCNSTTYSWPVSFADANYSVVCTGGTVNTGTPMVLNVNTIAAGSFKVQIINLGSGTAAQFTNVHCIGTHD